ncbi:CHAT domain-containing protein [Lactifluus volemus]|nr:CHAT domain-containing protein [Lactifluus volemus]
MNIQELSLPEIEGLIYVHQNILSLIPRFGPWRASCLEQLAFWRSRHHNLSDSHEQLEKSILNLAEALLLLPSRRTGRTTPNPVRLFFQLTLTLLLRWAGFPDDITDSSCGIKYLRYLRDLWPQGFDDIIPYGYVTSILVWALASRVELNPGDCMEEIREMTTVCRELLKLEGPPIDPFIFLGEALRSTRPYAMKGELGDQVVECLREADVRFPSRELSFLLACSLCRRFDMKRSITDYEEATTLLNRAITSIPDLPEDIRRNFQKDVLTEVARLSYMRFVTYGKPEHLEEAISDSRTILNLIPPDDPYRPLLSYCLASLADKRLDEFGIEVIEEEHHNDPHTIDLSSLTESLTNSNSSISNEQWWEHFRALDTLIHITDMGEIEAAIKYCRLLHVSIYRDRTCIDPQRVLFPFGVLLFSAFRNTHTIEYLDESIAIFHDALKMANTAIDQNYLAGFLTVPLYYRTLLRRRREDLNEFIQLVVTLLNDTNTGVSYKFRFSHLWAILARRLGHPSVTAAYENAFSLMQDTLYYAPTLESQHFRLVSMREHYEELPSHYASYQVHTGQINKAIETLERGRALLWSEMRGFRTSADKLRAVDSNLAAEFEAINGDLEKVTKSMVPRENMGIEGSEVRGTWETNPFGHLVTKQRQLLDDRDKLISRIRALPECGNFLKPPSFDTLRSAALRGPVIIINHCAQRSDILILLYDSPPSLITTTDDFYGRAVELRDRLVKARKDHSLESKQYQRALRFVLESLYKLVGKPVIEEFRKMRIPEQSRVWWYPTSVFYDGVKHYFSDLYIPSYTPTLSALIESRKPKRQTSGKPSILLVALPESLRHAIKEIWAIQHLNTTITSLISKKATPSSVVEGLRDHQFSHFVCHGNLEPGKPFDASFKLYGGQQLTLLEIVRSRLPAAEFAFLSACHTAELTEESISDEVLHLAAAMQYCGFRSVVGTMWAMADKDGHDLVEHFYESILSSDDEPGVAYYERSARALRDAVKNLRRRKVVALERWVNYVHYGA